MAVVGEKVFEIPAAAARLEIYLEICARSKLKRFETEMKKRFFFRKKIVSKFEFRRSKRRLTTLELFSCKLFDKS